MTVVDTVFGKTWKLSAVVAGGKTNSYITKMIQRSIATLLKIVILPQQVVKATFIRFHVNITYAKIKE